MSLITILDRIVQGEIVPQHDLLPYLSDPSLSKRIETNSRLASAFFMLEDAVAQERAKEFIRRAWLQSGFSKDLIDQFVKIHAKAKDTASIKEALKRIAVEMVKKGNFVEAMHYFDHWQYAYAIFEQQDKYAFDVDVMDAIRRMAEKYTVRKKSKELPVNRKVRLAYIIKGITEVNSVLIKINKQFAKYHDRSRFDVRFFVTENEQQIKSSKQGMQHLSEFSDLGSSVTIAPGSENRIERLVGVARNIADFDPDTIVVSAILANMDHYFVCTVLNGFPTVVFNQGPPAQYTPPDATWSIAWTLHPLIDSPVGCTPVPFEDDLFDPSAVTAAERSVYGIADDARLLISAGRLPKFQSSLFWQAVESVLKQDERNVLLAIGINESSRGMISGMLSEGLSDRVKLLGWCEQYLPVLKMADVVIDTYPNGGGYTIVDAMVMKIPVVAFRNNYLAEYDQTNWSPAQEIIQIDDLLVDRGDLTAFSSVLKRLLDEPEYRSELGQRCAEVIRSTRGNPLRMVQRCEQVYTKVIDGTIASHVPDVQEVLPSSTVTEGPKVTVVVPLMGDCSALDTALNSILVQTHPNWEALLIGTAGDAETESTVTKYLRTDKRFKRIMDTPASLSEALQSGLTAAAGTYFGWLLPSVQYLPEKLKLQISALEGNEGNVVAWGQSENGQPKNLSAQQQYEKTSKEIGFIHYLGSELPEPTSVLASVEMLRSIGGFSSRYSDAQEYELWMRAAANGCRGIVLQQNVVKNIEQRTKEFLQHSFYETIDLSWMLDHYLSEYQFSEFFPQREFETEEGIQAFIRQFFDILTDKGSRVNSNLLKERFKRWLADGLKTLPVPVRKRIIVHGKNLFSQIRNDSKIYEYYHHMFTEFDGVLSKARPVPPVFKPHPENHLPPERQTGKHFIELLAKQRSQFLKGCEYDRFQLLTEYLLRVTGAIEEEALMKFSQSVMINGNYESCITIVESVRETMPLNDFVKAAYLFSCRALSHPVISEQEMLSSISSPLIRKHLSPHERMNAPMLQNDSIQQWNFEGNVDENAVDHLIRLRCEECGHLFESKFTFPLIEGPSEHDVVCNECFGVRTFSDRLLKPFILRKNSAIAPRMRKPNSVPNIAFALRYTGSIGGGVNNMFQFAEWLQKMGCAVTVYSTEPNAPTRVYDGKFVVLKDHYDLPGGMHDFIICMCAMDVPKVMTRYHSEHVALLCQGYEGYHYGRTFAELRLDKYFFDEIHSLPAKKIVVSTHLVELFERKFHHHAMYVPNGIDHSVFYPNVKVRKQSPSILFVGNPFQKLKGSDFLMTSLLGLQKSTFAIPGLTVHVAIGGGGESLDTKFAMEGFTVQYHVGLNRQGMADLINSVDIVINTSWYEGFSLPVLEAMACGTPVITSNNMGAESFCSNGVNGFVVNFGDHIALSTVIHNILMHKTDITGIIREGIKTAGAYSTENTIRTFAEELSRYLSFTFPESKVQKLISQFSKTKGASAPPTGERKDRPTFSIMVPTYNQDSFVPQTLDSIREQTVGDWEAVVVNDGSTDNTKAVIEKYALVDERIRVFHKKNGGVASALNEALRNARGEWILWLSSDDLFEPNKLEIHLREFEKRPEGKFFYTNYSLLYHQTQKKVPGYPGIAPREDQVLSFFYTNFVNGISICIHRSVFESVGFFNESLRDAQDFDMWIRIASEYPFEYIDDRTCTYRVHPDQGASKFPEAGLYDSALSCAMFLNKHPFEKIFPLLDITSTESIDTMIKKTFSIVIDTKSFVNRLGFGRQLIDRLHEWVSNTCPEAYRRELNAKIQNYILAVLQKDPSREVRESFATLMTAGTDRYTYTPCDVFASAKTFIEERKKYVSASEAALFDKYLKRFDHVFAERETVNKVFMAAVQSMEQKQFQKTLDLLASITPKEHDEFTEDLAVVKGCAYLGLQDIEHAKSSFEDALAVNPNSSEACAGLGEVFYLAEMDQQSKTMYEWAVKNDPANTKAVHGLSRINQILGLPSDHNTLIEQEVEMQ